MVRRFLKMTAVALMVLPRRIEMFKNILIYTIALLLTLATAWVAVFVLFPVIIVWILIAAI
jgi:hypothetical protein